MKCKFVTPPNKLSKISRQGRGDFRWPKLLASIGLRGSISMAQPRNQFLLMEPTEPRRLRRAAEGHPQVLQEGIDGDGMALRNWRT